MPRHFLFQKRMGECVLLPKNFQIIWNGVTMLLNFSLTVGRVDMFGAKIISNFQKIILEVCLGSLKSKGV